MPQTMPLLRLKAIPEGDRQVRFLAIFPVPTEHTTGAAAGATLYPGDGAQLSLGNLTAPTLTTWRDQREVELATYRYEDAGTYHARLVWGSVSVTTEVNPDAEEEPVPTPATLPEVITFDVVEDGDVILRRKVIVEVQGLRPPYRLRVDGDVEQAFWLAPIDGEHQRAEWTLTYPKPGTYKVSVDLIDEDGFWVATLAETTVTVMELPQPEEESPAPAVVRSSLPVAEELALEEISATLSDRPAWLPFQYARPVWAYARTYTAPGGGRVSRILAPGTYLSIRAHTVVNGMVWYRTAGNDWIPANAVSLVQPSDLRGVKLRAEAAPPPEPTPPPATPLRRGIVTAYILNVRARPGVRPDNPPIDRLRMGTEVTIYEEAPYNGEIWYRIGPGRWVHSGWVRVLGPAQPGPSVRRGVVTASILNVRARPGVRWDNPPIDRLYRGTEVTIYEEAPYNGEIWYRIGPGRWVHSGWVRVVNGTVQSQDVTAASEEGMTLPVGWIVASVLNVRAEPGVRPDNPPIDQLRYKTVVPILEERVVQGARWYRIGENRWVYGGWVGVARYKPRPSSIGPNERWVGVCLKEQTAVAYEGDQPVYAALVATGVPQYPTVQGIFRTWLRLKWGRMTGGRPGTANYYYLEDVTWTMYFYQGYALHAAYWHDAFGRPRSHGCVNMSPYDAWWIFNWSGQSGARSPVVYVYWQ